MSKFEILCSETVASRVVVEAESMEEAIDQVLRGAVDLVKPVEGDNFEIDEVNTLEETA
jgi:hypothetical protein